MKKIIYTIILLMLVSIVFATPSLYFKKGEQIDLKVPCSNNGAECSAGATCEATILYPNGTALISGFSMTNQGSYHNVTLSSSLVTGEYQSTIFCVDGTNTGVDNFSFLINSMGEKDNDFKILGVYAILITIVFGYIFSAFKLDQEHLIPRLVLFLTGLSNLIIGLLVAYIDLVSAFDTSDMILYIFEGNIFILFILISYFMIHIIKKLAKFEEDKNDIF